MSVYFLDTKIPVRPFGAFISVCTRISISCRIPFSGGGAAGFLLLGKQPPPLFGFQAIYRIFVGSPVDVEKDDT